MKNSAEASDGVPPIAAESTSAKLQSFYEDVEARYGEDVAAECRVEIEKRADGKIRPFEVLKAVRARKLHDVIASYASFEEAEFSS